MRREVRPRKNNKKAQNSIIIKYSIFGAIIFTIILISLVIYSKTLAEKTEKGITNLEEMSKYNEQNKDSKKENEDTSVSTEIGKSVNEVKEESKNNTLNTTNSTNKSENTTSTNNKNNSVVNSSKNLNSTNKKNKSQNNLQSPKLNQNNKTENKKKELGFVKPVDGEIVKEFAKDNLLYSETLQEWTTHLGIDIKAEKTTVVKAAEAGVVKSIKNDPRYGLTIVIEHNDEYQTIYSNLLSSEFVVEGEKVEKGQSIGTVGNTAPFESADEPHLHFEILKNSVQVDPNIYL